jgi:hypothetical protein
MMRTTTLHHLPLSVALLLAVATATGAQPSVEADGGAMQRFAAGSSGYSLYSGLQDSARLVIRTAEEWQSVWTAINRPFVPPAALPQVDFAREVVLIAALGTRGSAGYAVRIDSVRHAGSSVIVRVHRTQPVDGCPVGATMTQPVDLVRIPAPPPAVPIVFVEHVESPACQANTLPAHSPPR